MSGPAPARPTAPTVDKGDEEKLPPPSGSLKAVQIAESIPELPADDDAHSFRKFRASPSRRLGGKSATFPTFSGPSNSDGGTPSYASDEAGRSEHRHHRLTRYQYYGEKLLSQVGEWLEHERRKAERRLGTTHRRKSKSPTSSDPIAGDENRLQRTDSIGSQSSDVSLDRLQTIIDESLSHLGLSAVPRSMPKVSRSRRRANSRSTLPRTVSSDTEYLKGDVVVPDCDAWLDNSKTIGYPGASASTDDVADPATKEREAWLTFKNDIIRIAHTLRLKGWRRVALERGDSITVERLSGALTNAVYVVTPPSDISDTAGKHTPAQILLRIYGPQVEHLIDRVNELKVLQRLARKKIGPRLLGTFKNGRFEQYFNAITLQPPDLRDPDTSRQIAKRMRELHDGIDLLPQERDNGPGVWRNWDQWLDNVAKIITYLDKQLEHTQQDSRSESAIHAWKANGYVCGVPWAQFRATVAKYRAHLNSLYRDAGEIKERLVFAHNDTQYGNILRIRPDDEKSPLLQAANKHKQLVVIDFEYAAANVPGLDIANHFTEWSYNYHDPVSSHACNTDRYPTPEEQRRFIKAYVDHRPQFPTASSTPRLRPVDGGSSSSSNVATPSLPTTQSSSSIIDFMLDARAPPGGWGAAEREREERSNQRVRELMEEARLWRLANSAMWVAWGIVQATVPGLDANHDAPSPDGEALQAEQEVSVMDFDYLRYAQDRALFFWGDAVQMGLAQLDELPDKLRTRLKMIDY